VNVNEKLLREKVDPYLTKENREDFWLPGFDKAMVDVKQKHHVEHEFIDRIEKISSEFPRLLKINKKSTLTHYDIGNVMLNIEDNMPKVTGFIDVQGYWADYARELSFMEMFGLADKYFYEIYTQYHELVEGFEISKSLYNLKMNLKHINMYPDQSWYRIGARKCFQIIEKAL